MWFVAKLHTPDVETVRPGQTVRMDDDFQLDYDQLEDCITVTCSMNTAYKMHRNRKYQHYSVSNSKKEALKYPYPEMNKEKWTQVYDLLESVEFQRRSAINRENRAKLKIVHTSGARSFQRTRALLKKWRRYSCSTSQRESHTQKWRFSLGIGDESGLRARFRPFSIFVGSSLQYHPLICPGDWRRPD
ncbi:hypothetical protein CJ030_MR4G018357 [Morella rubra]|uniref:Uncharacterized protein n=1 Tax=Morella rubra TaxID=262757 RepID=A0A6A1VZG2_9ROSI|nr:hypothetical protein CJ030_MR4G018357 [Morella rubra]